MSSPGRSDPDVQSLREARRESRTVLDHRIELVSKMDDIAMHTVRTSVVVLGILVSAAGIAGPRAIQQSSAISLVSVGIGGFLLLLSILYGIGLLALSEFSFGVASTHWRMMNEDDVPATEWETAMLAQYEELIADMRTTNRKNSNLLLYVLVSFVSGIGLITTGTAYMAIRTVL